MSKTTVEIRIGSDVLRMRWDPAEASAPITVDGEHTPFQTADARHRTEAAVRLVVKHFYGPIYETNEDAEEDGCRPGADAIVVWDDLEYGTLDEDGEDDGDDGDVEVDETA